MLEFVRDTYYDAAYFKRHYHTIAFFIQGIHLYAKFLVSQGRREMRTDPWKILLTLIHLPRIPKYENLFRKYEDVLLNENEWNKHEHVHEGVWIADMLTFVGDLYYAEKTWERNLESTSNATIEVPITDSLMSEASSSHHIIPSSVRSTSPEYTPTTPKDNTSKARSNPLKEVPPSPEYSPMSSAAYEREFGGRESYL